MKMMTKEIERKLPALYATEDIPTDEKEVVVKFFTPWSNWTWYAVEGEKAEDHYLNKDNEDWLFFGLVDGFEREWGYFSLSELEAVKGPFGLKIERDRNFKAKIGDLRAA